MDEGVIAGLIKSVGCQLVIRVLGRQAQKWTRVTKNKTVRAESPKQTIYGRLGQPVTFNVK